MNSRRFAGRAGRMAAGILLVMVVSLALAAKRCPNCGTTYPDEDNYCAECAGEDGKPLRLVPVPRPAPRPAPAPAPAPTAPAGMKALGRNAQGYEEALWLKDSSVMVKVPAGEFWMGSVTGEGESDERPQHRVYLDEFWLDKHEVTNRQYERFVKATGYRTDAEKEGTGYVYDTDLSKWLTKSGVSWRTYYGYSTENHPAVLVSWNDARAYCDWAGKRLPTEAEWEKAARGTDARKYPWGNEEPDAGGRYRANWGEGSDRAVWRRDGYEFTAPVGSFSAGASPYGLLDMAGNVWEWCNDWYDSDYYGKGVDRNPQGPATGSPRVYRGGSWLNNAGSLRSAYRGRYEPSFRIIFLGFRCAGTR
ncbi:MAG: SUMF1/EgtB/PvdO family nonheme iron enzyme [bacterium]